jgi:hypothetical protein
MRALSEKATMENTYRTRRDGVKEEGKTENRRRRGTAKDAEEKNCEEGQRDAVACLKRALRPRVVLATEFDPPSLCVVCVLGG